MLDAKTLFAEDSLSSSDSIENFEANHYASLIFQAFWLSAPPNSVFHYHF